MSQETAMQTWDLQKRNRTRTGERGMIPIQLPGLGIYDCTDGQVFAYVLAPGGAEFVELVAWMREEGLAEDLDDEPYGSMCAGLNMAYLTQIMTDPATVAPKILALGHINEVVGRFFATLSSTDAYERGQRRRLLIGLVSTPRDLAENVQLQARDWFCQLDVDYLGRQIEFPGPPYRLSVTPARISRPPRLGEHTRSVLAALQG